MPESRTSEEFPWVEKLVEIVKKRPFVVLRFDAEEWEDLQNSRRGSSEFTIARKHSLFRGIKTPVACIFQGDAGRNSNLYLGVISSHQAVTTLQSRIKIKRAMKISPNSEASLRKLITERPFGTALRDRLAEGDLVIALSPKLSGHIVERLSAIEANHAPLRVIESVLSVPRRFRGNASLQEDAVRTALRAFGLSSNDQAVSLELVRGRNTSLARVNIMEDSVVEHDARSVPGFELTYTDLTGRAVFERGAERLEVFTANRRDLEHVFGVDLIYLNITRQNIVMLQYKMLEPDRRGREFADWIYRPDSSLDDEISRMHRFSAANSPSQFEYRLNPGVFYLKFVKRDTLINNGGVITPIDHFERIRNDPSCRGPRGGLRISYNSLSGRYMRQGAFLDLIRSGYIGAHAETTANLRALIDGVLRGDRALVAAIQTVDPSASAEEIESLL